MILNPQSIKLVYMCSHCRHVEDKRFNTCPKCGDTHVVPTQIKRVITK